MFDSFHFFSFLAPFSLLLEDTEGGDNKTYEVIGVSGEDLFRGAQVCEIQRRLNQSYSVLAVYQCLANCIRFVIND